MPTVFLSYDREDGDFAEVVRDRLTERGFTVWMDLDRLTPGRTWRDDIDDAIRAASALVLVMSPEALASQYVTYEWAFALGAGLRVVTVLLKATPLPPRLEVLQYLDFTRRQDRPWDALADAIGQAAEARPTRTLRVPVGAPAIVEKAAAALDGLDPEAHTAALRSLAQMSHPAAREVLAAALEHPVEDVRTGAARALAALGDPRAIPGVVAQRDWLRLQLGRTLAPFGLAALPALLDALRTQPGPGREYLAYALAELPGAATAAEVVPTLLALLDDAEAAMRVAAVRSLGQLGTVAAVPALAGRLRDTDEDVRAAAADALRHLGTPEALAALGTGARPA